MKASILLTGASGFIGSELYENLEKDYNITAISSSKKEKFIQLNLLDREDCKNFFKHKTFDIIIHAAAIAHGKNNVNNLPINIANEHITKNVFDFLDTQNTIIIYLSSVSVYSYFNKKGIISVNETPVSVTQYGKSKLRCEFLLKNLKNRGLHILRLAPVYSDNNLKDLKKRIYLPVFNIPFLTKQERLYSFCHINQVLKTVKELMEKESSSIQIVKDEKDMNQIELLEKIKVNKVMLKLNTNLLNPFLYLLEKSSYSKARIIREMLYKLFFSVRYTNN